MTWIRGGAFASLALALVFALFRRWKLAKVAAAFAAAFAEKWREVRLAKEIRNVLAKAGGSA
jgi:hypothetical protein